MRSGIQESTFKKGFRISGKCISYLFIQIVVIMMLLEIFGYTVDPYGISYFPEMAAYLDTMILEEPIGYRNRPGLHDEFFGVPVVINSLGMRDREVPERGKNEFRILVVGDSLPFGIGVKFEDSLSYQLEKFMNEKGDNSRHIRTLNMGVPSYNTEQELIQLKQTGIGLQPQLVILLYSSNDIEPKMWIFEKRSSWYTNSGQRSYAVSLLYTLIREVRDHFLMSQPGQMTVQEYYDSRWEHVDNALTEMKSLLDSKGIPFVLFTWEESGHIFDLLTEVADREGFPVVTLNPWRDPRWKNEDPMKFRNSVIDAHPNAAGNSILAVLIAEALEKRGLVQLH
jgi:lysophospholipase L1-like esterase